MARTPDEYKRKGGQQVREDVERQDAEVVGADELSIGSDGPATSFADIGGGSGTADRTVSSTSDLESLPSDIQSGETVRIKQPSTPYRPSQWLDIDGVTDVSILAESRFAENGEAIIKPADGADVGGIRIGSSSTTSHVKVVGVGYDGNQSTMTDSAKRLHGFIAGNNASHVVFRQCYATQTHPYNEHNTGGSGFTMRHNATNVWFVNNLIEDIGDRGIQVAGDNFHVLGNVCLNGYDRSVSWNVTEPDGLSYVARYGRIVGNYSRGNSDGSVIGVGGGTQRTDRGYVTIMGNVGSGVHANLIQLGNTDLQNVANVSVIGNIGDGRNAFSRGSGVRGQLQGANRNVTVMGNVLKGYPDYGIYFQKGHDFTIAFNIVNDVGNDGIHHEGYRNINITGNVVRDVGGDGVYTSLGFDGGVVGYNSIFQAGDHGVNMQNGGLVATNSISSSNQNGSGSDEIRIGSTNVGVVGNYIESVNGANAFNDTSSGGNQFRANWSPNGTADYSVPDSTLINGEVVESASAETPQGTYPPGTMVRFTDSDGGSGTGTYLIDRSGNAIQIASSA